MTDTYTNEPTPEELDAASQPAIGGDYAGGFGKARQGKIQHDLDMPAFVSNAAEYEALKPGQRYIDPERNERVKQFVVKNRLDYERVPEGADYIDPEGNERSKPVYEGLGYTAQTLYSMAVTPKEKRKILEKFYPGQVYGEGDDLYVIDENGTYRKPGRAAKFTDALGVIAGNAAPMVGSVAGSLVGGAGGSLALPGAGTWGGGVVGGATGGALGQNFNDIILKLNGVYDRTASEDLLDKTAGIAASVAGDAAGRGFAAVVPTFKEGIVAAKTGAPNVANWLLKTNKEGVEQFKRLAELGEGEKPGVFGMAGSSTSPGVSTYAPGAPYLQLLQENLHEGFTTEQARRKAAEKAYEKMATPLLERAGVETVDDIVRPLARPSAQKAGTALKEAGEIDMGRWDWAFERELEKERRRIQLGLPAMEQDAAALGHIADERHRAATGLVQQGLADVEKDIQAGLRAAAGRSNSGDFGEVAARKLQAVHDGIGARYRQGRLEAAATVTPGARIPARPLSEAATDMVERLPDEFQKKFPDEVKTLQRLALRKDAETGAWMPKEEGSNLTFDELVDLRSAFRRAADYYDIPSSFKNGTMKQMASRVDDYLQALHGTPQFKQAVELQNKNDAWYSENIKIFNATEVNALMAELKAGAPADPEKIYSILVKPNHTQQTEEFKRVLGPVVWKGVEASQKAKWVQNARKGQFDGSVNAQKFADEILAAKNDGTLYAVQGREAGAALEKQAQQIAMLNGKLDVSYNPNDTAFDVFRAAINAANEAKKRADVDPLKVLGDEIANMEKSARAMRKADIANDPLSFLADKTVGADEAARRILASEDLVLATAARFGENSPAFKALRALWMERVFTGGIDPGRKLASISPDVQRIMMGVDYDTAQKLAEDMRFILGGKALKKGEGTGEGMMVVNKLMNPVAGMPGVVSTASKGVPGLNWGARAGRQSYYDVINRALESPSFARFLMKSYEGGAEKRAHVRQLISEHLQRGGAIGAGAGQGMYQTGGEDLSLSPESLGARQAPDGKHYIPDPRRPGKYLEVRP